MRNLQIANTLQDRAATLFNALPRNLKNTADYVTLTNEAKRFLLSKARPQDCIFNLLKFFFLIYYIAHIV